jgi:hypothetical protein
VAITYIYKDAFGASGTFDVDIEDAVRLGDLGPLEEKAEHLESGASTLTLDDVDADLGNAGDAIKGNQRISITESDCPVGNRRLYTGLIGERKYSRGTYKTGPSRWIDVTLHDLNALLSLRIIPNYDRTAIRPRESVEDRLTWFLSTSYAMDVMDKGLVVANATMMTKADYRGQRGVNIVNDCEMAAGFGWNAFVYWHEADAERALFFDNANTSTAYTSTLRISNVFEDLDAFTDPSAVTFAPTIDAELTRDPSNLGSGVYLPFENGAVFRERAATVDEYGRKDISAPNSNVKRRDRAREQADDFLWQHHTEEDRITVTVELPPSHVNLIRAGHRIQVKFSHLPGYEAFRWCRVLTRSPGQEKETQDRYTVHLELSPQEVPCIEAAEPTLEQVKYQLGDTTQHAPDWTEDFVLDAPSTIGNLLVVACMTPFEAQVAEAPANWNWVLQNVENEDVDGYRCNVFWKVAEGEDTVSIRFNDPDTDLPRVAFAEYALANPSLHAAVVQNLQDPGPGSATVPATTYPAGACAVITFCFMSDGPTGSDDLTASGTGMSLVYPIAGADRGNVDLGMGHMLRGPGDGSGTTPLYPAAGGWRFLFTGGGPTLSVGLTFTGGSCV